MGAKIYKMLMLRFELGYCVQTEHGFTIELQLISVFEDVQNA